MLSLSKQRSRRMEYYVYMVRCNDNSLYVGYTQNLEQRVKQHKAGHGGQYTSEHQVEEIIYQELFENKNDALKRESQLKKWSKAKKEALINRNFKLLKQFSISNQSPKRPKTM